MPLFFILLFLAIAAHGQQQRVAVINTLDDGEPPIKVLELIYLTDKLRETASNVLPKSQYGVMTTESIVAFFGSHERLVKVCNESSCLVELGRKVSADYVSQARIGRFGKDLTIRTELYDTKNGTLVGSFTGYSKDIYGLLTLIDEKAPDLFKKLLSTPSGSSTAPPAAVFAAPQQETAPLVAAQEHTTQTTEPYEYPSDRKTQPSLLSLYSSKLSSFGFIVGLNLSHTCASLSFSCDIYDSFGMQFGFVLDIVASDLFHIQPGLMYILKGGKEVSAHFLELPLLLSLKFSVLRLNAGPYFGLCLGDWSGGYNYFRKGFDIGLNTGIGFDIGKFYIGTFYDYGFADMSNKQDYKFYNRTFGLNVGVNL